MTIQPHHKTYLKYAGTIITVLSLVFGVFGSYFEIKSKLTIIETNQAEQKTFAAEQKAQITKDFEDLKKRMTFLERIHISR